jgi:hypothetical protein
MEIRRGLYYTAWKMKFALPRSEALETQVIPTGPLEKVLVKQNGRSSISS